MHGTTCNCLKCRSEHGFEIFEFPTASKSYREFETEMLFGEAYGKTYGESPFSEAEEMALAMELLSVSSEAELDQFLGKFLKSAWKGIKKVGRGIVKVARPFLKKALPLVGGALGSFIPIPGVGTAVGSALGGALGNALELEFAGMSQGDKEFEIARRLVRIAGTAVQRAAQTGGDQDPHAVMQAAWMAAAYRNAPQLAESKASRIRTARPPLGLRHNGRWFRSGRDIIVRGV